MTVKELKKALEGVKESLDVTISFSHDHPDFMRLVGANIDHDFQVLRAKREPESAISRESFDITPGGGFGY